MLADHPQEDEDLEEQRYRHPPTDFSDQHPATVQLKLNGQTWELDEFEQGSIEVSLTELRRTRYWKHETWCDREQHVLAAKGAELDETPCVGRQIRAVGGELIGWWHQSGPGAEPRFYVDASSGDWNPARRSLEIVDRLLAKIEPKDDLWGLMQRALGKLEHGATCGEQS